MMREVGLFFVADGELLLHTCAVKDGEKYGDFINYPESHLDVWERDYAQEYGVDFDYYPRGRIVYNHAEDFYILYHDKCVAEEAAKLCGRFPERKCKISLDEHYQCYKCNKDYNF